MASLTVTHLNTADNTFSTAGAAAWDAAHVVDLTDATGPTGPDGAAGTTGPSGPTGPTGAGGNPSARVVFAESESPKATNTEVLTSPSLFFSVESGVPYQFQFRIPWRTQLSTNGIRAGLSFPARISNCIACKAIIGVGSENRVPLYNSGQTSIISQSAPTLDNNYLQIDGSIYCSAPGTLHVLYGAELSNQSGVFLMAGASGIIWAIA